MIYLLSVAVFYVRILINIYVRARTNELGDLNSHPHVSQNNHHTHTHTHFVQPVSLVNNGAFVSAVDSEFYVDLCACNSKLVALTELTTKDVIG